MDLVNATIAWFTDPLHWQAQNGIPNRLEEHVLVSLASLAIAVVIGLALGLWIGHTGRFTTIAINSANLWRALPSLAVIAILIPLTSLIDPVLGFLVYPTLFAMVVLAVPPILVNTYAGIAGVDRDLVEAARGMGMRERQVLIRVEIPVALPVIAGGVRSAATQVVATCTLGAIFGFGGLGRYLVDGIAQQDDGQIFGGVVLVAALALTTDAVFALIQHGLTSPGLRPNRPSGPEPLREPAELARGSGEIAM